MVSCQFLCYSYDGGILYLKLDNKQMEIIVAKGFFCRFWGLMNKKEINYGMFFPKCKAIHTFFMKEAIDLIAIDENNKIIFKESNIKPWRIIKIKNKQKKTSILELPKDTCYIFRVGDFLSFEDEDIS